MVIFTRVRRWIEHWHKKPFRQIGRGLYWLRTHTINKYHLIDLRSSRNGYAWGWLDASEGILFANMAILVRFIEKEKPFNGHVDWRSAEEVRVAGETENDPGGDACRDGHAAAKKEMLEIYNWWVKGRKEEHDAFDKTYDEAYKDDKFEFEPIENGFFRLKDRPVTPTFVRCEWIREVTARIEVVRY